MLKLNSRRPNYVELLTCDSIYIKVSLYLIGRIDQSRTETTDSILIEENDQDDEPELPSSVGNVIHSGEQGL